MTETSCSTSFLVNASLDAMQVDPRKLVKVFLLRGGETQFVRTREDDGVQGWKKRAETSLWKKEMARGGI